MRRFLLSESLKGTEHQRPDPVLAFQSMSHAYQPGHGAGTELIHPSAVPSNLEKSAWEIVAKHDSTSCPVREPMLLHSFFDANSIAGQISRLSLLPAASTLLLDNNHTLQNLHDYLALSAAPLKLSRKVQMALDIGNGLLHLGQNGIVHGRLTSRSCFVTEDGVVKVGDLSFAFCREHGGTVEAGLRDLHLNEDDWFCGWEAVEVLTGRECRSVHSDVWSFATVMWEIMSNAATPFDGLSVSDIKSSIVNGDRLSHPSCCPPYLYDLMLQSWTHPVINRISLEDLVRELTVILSNPHIDVEPFMHTANQQAIPQNNSSSVRQRLNISLSQSFPELQGLGFAITEVNSSNPAALFSEDWQGRSQVLSQYSLIQQSPLFPRRLSQTRIGQNNTRRSRATTGGELFAPHEFELFSASQAVAAPLFRHHSQPSEMLFRNNSRVSSTWPFATVNESDI